MKILWIIVHSSILTILFFINIELLAEDTESGYEKSCIKNFKKNNPLLCSLLYGQSATSPNCFLDISTINFPRLLETNDFVFSASTASILSNRTSSLSISFAEKNNINAEYCIGINVGQNSISDVRDAFCIYQEEFGSSMSVPASWISCLSNSYGEVCFKANSIASGIHFFRNNTHVYLPSTIPDKAINRLASAIDAALKNSPLFTVEQIKLSIPQLIIESPLQKNGDVYSFKFRNPSLNTQYLFVSFPLDNGRIIQDIDIQNNIVQYRIGELFTSKSSGIIYVGLFDSYKMMSRLIPLDLSTLGPIQRSIDKKS